MSTSTASDFVSTIQGDFEWKGFKFGAVKRGILIVWGFDW